MEGPQLERNPSRLSEALVLARTRAPDLESVRKLNCWASNISNASIVRHMPNLEVCSLSVNNISSLEDFSHCPNLTELFIRKNRVMHLSDIHFLRRLPKLRSLWLADNPCAQGDNYRLTVLRTLPNLQKLDNAQVTEEELNKALEEGEELPIPEGFEPGPPETTAPASHSKSSPQLNNNSNSANSNSGISPRNKNHRAVDNSIDQSSIDQSSDDPESKEEEEEEDDSGVEAASNHFQPEASKGVPSFGVRDKKQNLDSVILSQEETNLIRAQLGLKPLPVTKFSTNVSQGTSATKARNSNILQSVMMLVRELDKDSLEIVHNVIRQRLQDM